MIKKPAARIARIAAAAILVSGLAVTLLLNRDAAHEVPNNDSAAQLAPPAQFDIHWRPGALTLSGHTVSDTHEEALLRIVETSYPDVTLRTDFQAMSAAPSAWGSVTELTLTAVAATRASTVEIASDSIAIRSVVAEDSVWQEHLDSLARALPADVSIAVDRILLVRDADVVSLCDQAFATFKSGPINFEESGSAFRSSAYPNLARIVALANTCTESVINITGHTDASGPEDWNQQLSLERATVVGDYIAAKGINTNRLHIVGAGPSAPIATNATRYGRSFNRRIEIEFGPTPAL